MKHPFHTLYYTGLTVLIFLFLFCGLLIFNLSDIIELIPKNKTPKVQSNVVLNPVVLKTSTPKPFVELNNSKVEKKGITNTEIIKSNTKDTNSTHNNMNNETPNTSNNQDTSQGNRDTI
jgi:hypothetical protein